MKGNRDAGLTGAKLRGVLGRATEGCAAVGGLVRLHACGQARGARWDLLACPWSVGAGMWMPRNHTQRSMPRGLWHMHNVKVSGHTLAVAQCEEAQEVSALFVRC